MTKQKTGKERTDSRMHRLAFVAEDTRALVNRLVSGVCRFATPRNGFITREFIIDIALDVLPDSFAAWSPVAVVSFLGEERHSLLAALGAGKRPVVNMARCEPRPGLGVVLGDAEELYAAIHQHFNQLGIRYVAQFTMAVPPSEYDVRSRYKQYTDEHHLDYHSFGVEYDSPRLEDFAHATTVEPTLAHWLQELPKPAGLFSQQTIAGAYLCHCCGLLGIRVPQDVAVIGSDGFDVALASRPPLTVTNLPAEKIGYRAAEVIAAMLQGSPSPPEIIRVPGLNLVVRESTGKVPSRGCDIDLALQFIDDHACQGVTVNDIISHTQSVSRMTFHKRFTKLTGTTPAAAIMNRRMSEARRLVAETNLSIGAIAGMCGYVDDLYFSQVFRKTVGVAPRDYRRLQLR